MQKSTCASIGKILITLNENYILLLSKLIDENFDDSSLLKTKLQLSEKEENIPEIQNEEFVTDPAMFESSSIDQLIKLLEIQEIDLKKIKISNF